MAPRPWTRGVPPVAFDQMAKALSAVVLRWSVELLGSVE